MMEEIKKKLSDFFSLIEELLIRIISLLGLVDILITVLKDLLK